MFIKTTGYLGAGLAVWLMGMTLAQAGALFKWVGEDGSVHYSAQSPVLNKSQSMQRLRLHAKGSKEILAPDFDSSRNIVAEEANAMMSQDTESARVQRNPQQGQRKQQHDTESSNMQVHATQSTDRSRSTPQNDGSPKNVVDALTNPVQMQ